MKDRTNSEKLARIVSTLFVPPSFTLLLFSFLAFYLEHDLSKSLGVLGVTLSFGFFFQIAMFVYFWKKGKVTDLDASVKDERTIPYFVAIGIYSLGLLVLMIMHVHPVISAFWFCYISNTLIVIFINRHWKISAHLLGISGPLAALTYAVGFSAFYFLTLLLLLAWARLKLKCHTPAQLIAGAFFGFFSTLFQMDLIIKLFQ